MRLEPLISHTGILMTFYLSIILDLQKLKALWIVSFKRVFNLSCDRVVYRVEKSKVLMEDTWEKDKLHKTPYKERYIAGSSTCSTKELSIHLTNILSAVKEGQKKYCETSDLWLAGISSLSHEVGFYVVLLEVLLFMPNSLIRHSK
jgi:hypothetical protein